MTTGLSIKLIVSHKVASQRMSFLIRHG